MTPEVFTRSVPATEVALDGSTLEAMFVPWNEPTTIYGEGDPYQEGFKRGAFTRQLERFPQTIKAVTLIPEHGSTEHYGRTRQLTETDAGLHGVVTVMASHREDVAQLVEMGVEHLSIEFMAYHRPRQDASGVKWRTSGCILEALAMTPNPAYGGAKVLALREADEAQAEAERRARELAEVDQWLEQVRQ